MWLNCMKLIDDEILCHRVGAQVYIQLLQISDHRKIPGQDRIMPVIRFVATRRTMLHELGNYSGYRIFWPMQYHQHIQRFFHGETIALKFILKIWSLPLILSFEQSISVDRASPFSLRQAALRSSYPVASAISGAHKRRSISLYRHSSCFCGPSWLSRSPPRRDDLGTQAVRRE